MQNEDKYKAALERIANFTLWGEPIKDQEEREEAIDSGQYDVENDVYNPCADAETNMLREAVECAREALGMPVFMEACKQE